MKSREGMGRTIVPGQRFIGWEVSISGGLETVLTREGVEMDGAETCSVPGRTSIYQNKLI
jgi:hypothetical protein